MTTLDAITLSVIQAGLQQVCDEMDLTFSRAAFSPVIAEANDRSDGIYSAEDGSLIAQGIGGLPVFVGVMQYSTRTLIEMIRDGNQNPAGQRNPRRKKAHRPIEESQLTERFLEVGNRPHAVHRNRRAAADGARSPRGG